ncbi:MAG: CatA-like O-acetyltransferase [Pikeienuella sp.]
MAEHEIELGTWSRTGQFELFRGYQTPRYTITSRIDVSRLLNDAKPRDVSAYRACLFAIGAGVHAVPELLMRFRGDRVFRHDAVELSMTVPQVAGGFGYAYVPFVEEFGAFDAQSRFIIDQVAQGGVLAPNTGQRDDLAYLSCLPWMDFTSISNALPGPEDCIPRISWGKFVERGDGWDMAMALDVHHALVDGEQVGRFFDLVQRALDRV